MDNKEKEILKLHIQIAKLEGQFKGVLQGILWWDLPKELKIKLETVLEELNKN